VVGLTSVRRLAPLVLLLGLAAGALPAASAVQPTGFAFGRLGGNIRPYTVSIANSGTVRTSGAVEVGRTMVTSVQLATLNRVATETSFVTMPATTNCRGTLPDVASTFIRVGARTVRVHGVCVPRYQRLLKALQASVRIV
jgi:hypothetical protein